MGKKTFYEIIKDDDLVKKRKVNGFVRSSRYKACKDCDCHVDTECRKWTFSEADKDDDLVKNPSSCHCEEHNDEAIS